MTNPQTQPVDAGLTSYAIFLVVLIADDEASERTARTLFGDVAAFVRAVGFRSADGQLSCVTGIGSDAWKRLYGEPRPKELHPFREIRGVHHAPGTPGDLLFHIRASRMDLCFELAHRIMESLGGAATVADEVHGFAYFDQRDLLGFVDGTENPSGSAAADATIIGREPAMSARGGKFWL